MKNRDLFLSPEAARHAGYVVAPEPTMTEEGTKGE